jgi:hypothetical protein
MTVKLRLAIGILPINDNNFLAIGHIDKTVGELFNYCSFVGILPIICQPLPMPTATAPYSPSTTVNHDWSLVFFPLIINDNNCSATSHIATMVVGVTSIIC